MVSVTRLQRLDFAESAVVHSDEMKAALIVGDEKSVEAQVRALAEAGATDLWAQPIGAGDDRRASLRRTMSLLRELAR